MTTPLNPSLLKRRDEIRRGFQSDNPLPQFQVVPDFLRGSILDRVLAGCRNAQYSTFCAYCEPTDRKKVLSEFCEPREGPLYVTVHQRPTYPIRELEWLSELFNTSEALAAVADLTGISAKRCDDGVLTCWGPETFVEAHTDYVPQRRQKLVLSLSLTEQWDHSYGGTTVFAWTGLGRAVRMPPRLNTAVLFVPFSGSFHWVEQISKNAPAKRRFTWTLFFS